MIKLKKLLRRLGLGRVLSARDLEDTWSRRIAAITKPAAILNALLTSSLAILVATAIAVSVGTAAGYRVVPTATVRLAGLVEDLVQDANDLSRTDLRIRFRAAARAVTVVHDTIVMRSADSAAESWHKRFFGRPSPLIDPGREAVLLGIVDRISTYPAAERGDLIDQMMLWTESASHREAWALVKQLGDLPAEVRRALIGADAKALGDVLIWLQERVGRGAEIRHLQGVVNAHRLELSDQSKALQDEVRSMTRRLESARDRRRACQRHSDLFHACMMRASP